jgi:hypothetical protein
MQKYLIIILLSFTITGCSLRVTEVITNNINGTLKSEFNDSITFIPNSELFTNKSIRIAVLTNKNFVKVMPNDEYNIFIHDADSTFDKNGVNIINFQKIKEAFILNSYRIDSSFASKYNVDYFLVIDSLKDNFNGFVKYYYDENGKKHLMPTISYPDSLICDDPLKFENWKNQHSIIIDPMTQINSNRLFIEIIYGYAITKVYSGKDGTYLGDIKIYISDFDLNSNIKYEFSSKITKYNQTKYWVNHGDGKTLKIKKDLDVYYYPNGLYGLFSFGAIYGEKISRILYHL